MVYIKNTQEIEAMRRAGAVVAQVFATLAQMVRPGVSTAQLDLEARRIIEAAGATPSFLNYGSPPFPAAICASVNEEVVHGIPREDRILQEGDIISVDVGAFLDGFHGDAARTYAVGEVAAEATKLIQVTEDCFWKAAANCYIGKRVGDISQAVSDHAESFGYGVVRDLTGHGIGRNLHEEPDVPNFGTAGRGLRLTSGMALAIEPMINLGSRFVEVMEDHWTIRTRDKQLSAHYENTVIITDSEPIITTVM